LLGLLASRERQDVITQPAGLPCIGGAGSDRAAVHVGMGQTLMRQGSFESAVTAFRDALCFEPMNVEALRHLVCGLEVLGRSGDAARGWLGLGIALEAYDRFDEALAAYRQALAREPRCLDALIKISSVHLALGDTASAVHALESALAIEPSHAVAHIRLGRASHLHGDVDRGWNELSWSCDRELVKSWRQFEQPMWDGSSLAGRTILLWTLPDYGLGDTIQLARFAAVLKSRGASRVIVDCQRPLQPLLARMPAIDRVVSRLAPLPSFDVHAPLMLVPIVDRRARESVGAGIPYVFADDELMEGWRRRLGAHAGMTIGLCWGTQSPWREARWRSAPLTTFAPLAEIENARFISLQLGSHAEEAFAPPPKFRVESVLTESSSIDETAALIATLDLVITIDTMIAHLAGALGRPVWTVLPFDADWKWSHGTTPDSTDWYPTMRLFRQRRAGDWDDVVQRVRDAFSDCQADKTFALPSY
jgi:hypothetical protein